MSRRVTIHDVARAAGVSHSTVSLVLRHSDKIRPETAEKVVRAAKKIGYVYNRAAANLRRQSSTLVGMIIHDLTNPFYAELAVAIERALTDAGYVVVLSNTSENLERQDQVIAALIEHGAAGILICPAHGSGAAVIEPIQKHDIAVTTTMVPITDAACDMVIPDYALGMEMATTHLLAQGLWPLAFIGGNETSPAYQRRLEGVFRALAAAGKAADDIAIRPCEITRAAAAARTMDLMTGTAPPQGIIGYSDVVAMGVMIGLDQLGLKAGQDVAVTGFDDIMAVAEINPPLTSVHVFTEQLGELASRTLLARIENPGAPVTTNTLTPKLIVRQSSVVKT